MDENELWEQADHDFRRAQLKELRDHLDCLRVAVGSALHMLSAALGSLGPGALMAKNQIFAAEATLAAALRGEFRKSPRVPISAWTAQEHEEFLRTGRMPKG